MWSLMEIENSQFLNNYLDIYKYNDIITTGNNDRDDRDNFVWKNIFV